MGTQTTSKIKANLFDLNNGYYISKNDPLFWKKLFQRQSENEEALFHLGLDLDREASKYLEQYYETRAEKFLNMYRRTIAQAVDFERRSFNKGYMPARPELLRLEREMQRAEKKIAKLSEPASFSKKQVILLLIMAVILSIIGGSLLHIKMMSSKTNYSNHNYAFMLPYEVIENRPDPVPDSLNNQAVIILSSRENDKEKIVNALIQRLKEDYVKEPYSPKQVLAIDEKKQELGMAIWEGGDKAIRVFIYPSDCFKTISSQELQLWEATTVIRSALYQFARNKGHLPNSLEELCQAYPDNYLSELPKEPFDLKNTVTTSPTRDGGWLFSLVESPSDQDLVSVVKNSLKPNLPYSKDIPFEPLVISIDKTGNTLSLVSANIIIRKYNVALGKDDSTPEGSLWISRKIMNPDKYVPKKDNVYGTRALELSNLNYAIHGTNLPSEVGKNISHGCIRLNNWDIEELYALVPLNTPVVISKNPTIALISPNKSYSSNKNLYSYDDESIEEDPLTQYHWAN